MKCRVSCPYLSHNHMADMEGETHFQATIRPDVTARSQLLHASGCSLDFFLFLISGESEKKNNIQTNRQVQGLIIR